MEKAEFVDFLRDDMENFEVAVASLEDADGVYVKNNIFNTETHFTYSVIERMELKDLIIATHHGKNVEHMTRVTGYFSKVEGWNKGKKGELKDRSRSKIE